MNASPNKKVSTSFESPAHFLSGIETKGIQLRSDEEILEELKIATAGLFVMSESDYPFEIVRWDGQIGAITPEYLRRVSGVPADSPIEETDLDNFLKSGQFRDLAILLKESLSDLKVYKVGTINIPVYIVGRSAKGNWLGLSTRLIQT